MYGLSLKELNELVWKAKYHSVQEFRDDLSKHPFNREAIYKIMRKGLTIRYNPDASVMYSGLLSCTHPIMRIGMHLGEEFASPEEKDFTIIHELVHCHHLFNLNKFIYFPGEKTPLADALENVVNNEAQIFFKNDLKFVEYVKRFSHIEIEYRKLPYLFG